LTGNRKGGASTDKTSGRRWDEEGWRVCLLVLACIFRGALLTYSSVKDIRGLASFSA
jgi:hypothetical protein